jgi:hypothetical protein
VGLFDSISGIFRSGVNAVTNFGGGAFSAFTNSPAEGAGFVGPLRPGAAGFEARQTSTARRAGNIFGDIAESFISNAFRAGPTPTGTAPTSPRGRPSAGAQNVPTGDVLGLESGFINAPATGAAEPTGVTLGEILFGPVPGLDPRAQQASVGAGAVAAGRAVAPFVAPAARAVGRFLTNPKVVAGATIGQLAETAFDFFGGDDVAGSVALPGGAVIQQPVAPQAGRIFNINQNMSTGAVSVRARSTLLFMNPVTGNPVWYRNMGRPILWSGDIAARRRVNRIAARVRSRRSSR